MAKFSTYPRDFATWKIILLVVWANIDFVAVTDIPIREPNQMRLLPKGNKLNSPSSKAFGVQAVLGASFAGVEAVFI